MAAMAESVGGPRGVTRPHSSPNTLPPVLMAHRPQANQPFQPLPPPVGEPPFHVELANFLNPQQLAAIQSAGRLAFHCTGDTGGVQSPQSQQLVASHMCDDCHAGGPDAPAFLYLVGDVVYFYGQATDYYAQFYSPYEQYPAPIFAIPGNHDGDPFDKRARSLNAFVENFCATRPHLTREAGDTPRDAMTQPHVYFTLETPYANIVGLYTNVPEGGQLDATQTQWLDAELKSAPPDRALILALHHPVFSLDYVHHGSKYLLDLIDNAVAAGGRHPDLVLTGHVHNYQRFTRTVGDRRIPFIVTGAGGYWHLHSLPRVNGQKVVTPLPIPDVPGVTLDAYCDDRHGYLKVVVGPGHLSASYWSVPRPHESWTAPATQVDAFTVDLKEPQLTG